MGGAAAALSAALLLCCSASLNYLGAWTGSIKSLGKAGVRVCSGSLMFHTCKTPANEPRPFDHPVVQAFLLYVVAASMLLVAPSRPRSMSLLGPSFIAFAAPALYEVASAVFIFLAAGSGSSIATPLVTIVCLAATSMLSPLVVSRSSASVAPSREITGLALIVLGVAVPVVASNSFKELMGQPAFGIVFAVVAGIFRAMKLLAEEKLLLQEGASPLASVGYQGVWAVGFTGGALIVMHAVPSLQYGTVGNVDDAIYQIANSNTLQTALFATAAFTSVSSWLGARVSLSYSSSIRVAIGTLTPLALWVVSAYQHGAAFDPVAIVGFLLLVSGYSILASLWEGERFARSVRFRVYSFLQGTTEWGFMYEIFAVLLICVNIACFVLGTMDGLGPDVIAAFNQIERFTILLFSLEYVMRFWASAEEDTMGMYEANGDKNEMMTRVRWATSFYSLVDLSSLIPVYIELASMSITKVTCGTGSNIDLPAFQFLRMFRLFRIMRLDGKYLEAFTIFDDIYRENKRLIFTSSFVGGAVWIILSGANWAAERNNPAMEGRFDTILKASYFTLCNLFGEFPMVNERTPIGKFIGVLTAGIAVAVFAIPTGIFGNGFQEHAEQQQREAGEVETRSEVESGEGIQWTVYSFVKGKSTAGKWYERGMILLIVANVTSFIIGSTLWAESNAVIKGHLDNLELASVVIFSVDYVLRFYSIGLEDQYSGLSGRLSYITSFYSVVDLAAVLPFYAGILTPLAGINTSFIRALRLLRMLKAEAYVEAFTVFDDIMYNNRDVLTVTGFASVVLWVFFSSVMYLLEKDNTMLISPRGDHYYGSIPASMWITLLNLTGEVPLCDYTPWGKVVSGIMGVVAVGSFAIPIGILGAGFEDWVSNRYLPVDSSEARWMKPSAHKSRPTGLTGEVYDFLEGRTWLGGWYTTLLFYIVFATVAQQSLGTVPSFVAEHGAKLDALELIFVCIFTADYVLRVITAHHDPEFAGKSMPNLRYVFSFYSIIDLLTTAPYFIAIAFPGSVIDQYDEALRMLRLLRLLKMDKYIPSVTLIDDVFRNNAVPLAVTGFTASVFWVIFATMLWMAEDGDTVITGDNGITQGQRFQDVPTALQYTLILLSGDYPLCDFVFWGQVTCFLMCLFAVSVVSIPSSIIAKGFTDVALKERARDAARRGITSSSKETKVPPPKYIGDGSLASDLHSLLSPDDDKGVWFDYMNLGLILASVAAVVLESDPAFVAYFGSKTFDSFELITTVVFTLEYGMRLAAAPHDPRAGYSVKGYLTSFFGVADFVALLPWYLDIGMSHYGYPVNFALIRVIRLIRVLQLEHFTEAFTLIDDVFRECKDTLVATSFLAVIIWVGAAYAFFVTEKGNPNVGGAFDNIPNSLYYTAIFLSGEWGQVDFSLPGKVLCCFLVVVGIGLYSIPVGALFDAFGEVLAEEKKEQKKKEE